MLTGFTIFQNYFYLILIGNSKEENDIIANTMSLVNFLASFTGFFALMKYGRRTLMLCGYFLMATFLLVSGVLQILEKNIFLELGFVVFFMFSFGLSVGHMWLYLSEIMNPKATSFAIGANQFSNILLSMVTPYFLHWLSDLEGGNKNIGWLLIVLSTCCYLVFLFLYKFMLETMGLTSK